jgi:hypothetical protein
MQICAFRSEIETDALHFKIGRFTRNCPEKRERIRAAGSATWSMRAAGSWPVDRPRPSRHSGQRWIALRQARAPVLPAPQFLIRIVELIDGCRQVRPMSYATGAMRGSFVNSLIASGSLRAGDGGYDRSVFPVSC